MFEESEEEEQMRGSLLINGICGKNLEVLFDFKFNVCKQDNVTATKQNKKAAANSLY